MITDNNFTPEEFEAAITANPALLQNVTGTLTKQEYLILGKDERPAYEETISTRAKSELTLQHATEVEKSVEELTGIKKTDANEKWTAYYQRALKEGKSALTKIAELEGKSDISAAERQQLENLRLQVTEKDGLLATEKSERQKEIFQLKTQNKIYSEISVIDAKLKKDPIYQEAIALVRDNVISKMISGSTQNGTSIVFNDAEGKPIMNANKTAFATAKEVYEIQMDKYLEKAPVVVGADGKPVDQNPNIGNFKSKDELTRHLTAQGLMVGTPAFTKEFNRLEGNKLPLRV